ncbi:PREDICTED: nuclear factor 7, brain-like [Cyprinodon variegatus]|uniref:nuclear factor 7, brain-like n=1 Tax=Cyprinodon variegatus TaxID=28743 RepID=UPI00074266E5|nr:PREDICTED: nuclear factor 7, brain-like [Cyprinodon variegatus]
MDEILLEDYLRCHVCSETFRDPVSLSCNHSFCSSCLNKFWEQTGNKNCPICKRHSSKEFLPVNFGLKDLSDTFAGRQESESSETEREERHPMSHKLVPIEQAVSELKEQLKSDLKYLQDKRNKHKELEKTYDDIIQYSKNKLLSTESQIRAEFNKLHQFLREEEESRLAALREEEEQKGKTISREMKRIQEQISSLSDSISAVEEDLQKDQVSFLSSYKATQSRARAQSSLSDPQLVSGGLIDVAKHLGNLSFRVLEMLKDKVHFSPVILDPNTANAYLYLSDDLTSVRYGDKWQQLPDNPERNTETPSVFGSEGFSSGKHSWDVEVGDHPIWNIGLVKESANRKGERYASPKYGIWCLWHRDGKYSASGKNLSVNKSVQRIRVQLDYDSGEVSFYDREDMSHMYTYRDTFTEKLLPYFSIGKPAETSDIRICQSEIFVFSD